VARYIVTGGAGFIGSAIARRLVARGDSVTIVDDLSSGLRENIPAGAHFVHADLARDDAFAQVSADGVAAILHLGGQPSAEVSHADPIGSFDANERGTFLLLRWAEAHRIRRVLFASSMAVYGSSPHPVAEDVLLEPASFYGCSKLAAEVALAFFRRRGGEPTVLRMFNVFGPGQNLANLRQGMVSIYMAYLLRGEPILVKGAPDRFRDLVYIDDVAEGWIRALADPTAIGRTYNVGTGVPTTVRSLVETLRAAAGDPRYPVVFADATAGDVHGSVANISRIASELGWQPQVSLADGVARMLAWARNVTVPAARP
jgi:UDP-glucose 4-epimerase